ncbi:MAG: MurR/RpiR family transcriptional regulator [Blautia sp.]
MEDFFNKLTIDYDSFTHSQKAIANYLIENQDNVAFDTLEDLSEKIGVSTTTVIRFSRVLGYHGYSDMQKDIQNNVRTKAALPDRFDKTNLQIPKNQLLQHSFSNDMNNIQKTLSLQKDQDLEQCIQLISQAENLFVLGMRASFSIAHYFASRVGEIKSNVHLISSTGMIYPEEINSAQEGDVCVAYIFPRYSKTATTILSWFRNCGVKIILITSQNVTSVMGYGDIILPCTISSVYYKNSYAAPLCLTNFLIAALAQAAPEEARRMLERTENILSQGFFLGL